MKKNTSLTQFKQLSINNLTSPTNKKIQGFDITSKSTFINKVETLKNKPNKHSVEDQYIHGLQDQIHFLELQLKLLQEKDQAKHGQIDQLQKFFSDGVPINENILAIKNGFNNYKNAGEKKVIQLESQKAERENLIEGLKKRIIEMDKQLEKQEKEIRTFEVNKNNEIHSLFKSQAKLKKQFELQDDELKQLKAQNRKLTEKLSSLQRNKEIEMVMILKNQNHKMDKLSKLKDSITQKQAEYDELEKQFEQMLKQEEEKTYVVKIEEENLNLKKKAISLERELNSLQTKAQEKQMELDIMLKQRHKEICAKTEMKNRVDAEKTKITLENSLKVQDIEKVAKEKQISLLQKIISQNKKLSKYTEYYGELLAKVEDEIQKMGERKPQLKSQIHAYQVEVKRLINLSAFEKVRQTDLYADIVESEIKNDYFKGILPVLIQKSDKASDKIKIYKNEKEKLIEDVKVKEKQLDLLLILKSLNLQQVQMSKSSSSHIQDKLINFIRNWQQLQRNN